MITLIQVQEFIDTEPFRPFTLVTISGNAVIVLSPDRIKLPPAGFDLVIVFGNDGLVHYLPSDSILEAAVYGPPPHPIDS